MVCVTNVKELFTVLVTQKYFKWRPAKKSTLNLLCNAASMVEQKEISLDKREYRFKKI